MPCLPIVMEYWRRNIYENGDVGLADSYFFGNPRPARNLRGVLRHSVGMGALGFLGESAEETDW
jgi:hypothetical protein